MAENVLGTIRAGILGSKKGKSKVVEMFGQKVEVRQPSVGQLLDLENRNDDRKAGLVNLLVTYCYVPGTDQKVFTFEDKNELLALPAGDWLTQFNGAVSDLTGVNVEEAEKNSEPTA